MDDAERDPFTPTPDTPHASPAGEHPAGKNPAAEDASAHKTSDIRLAVVTSSEGVERIRWEADDAPGHGPQEAKAMILALWDAEARSSLRIDLWTQDMAVHDMNDFVFQTLLSLADSYHRATNNAALRAELKLFAQTFAEKAAQAERRKSA